MSIVWYTSTNTLCCSGSAPWNTTSSISFGQTSSLRPFLSPQFLWKYSLPCSIQQSRLGWILQNLVNYLSSELYELLNEQLREARKRNFQPYLHLSMLPRHCQLCLFLVVILWLSGSCLIIIICFGSTEISVEFLTQCWSVRLTHNSLGCNTGAR